MGNRPTVREQLPADLVTFLQRGAPFEYDPAQCGAGRIELLPLDRLEVQLFPVMPESPDDPHVGENGIYVVRGISLVASCDGYDAVGLLLWLPEDQQYGLWDPDHAALLSLGTEVTWSDIVQDPPRYINAHWGTEGAAPVSALLPWARHPYSPEQFHEPLPDVAEWYAAHWLRRGTVQAGAPTRLPEELKIRVERDADRLEVVSQIKRPEPSASWSARETHAVSADEWQRIQAALESGFWSQASMSARKREGETESMWTLAGFRGARYHKVFRSYGAGEGDETHALGEHLARLARLPQFERG